MKPENKILVVFAVTFIIGYLLSNSLQELTYYRGYTSVWFKYPETRQVKIDCKDSEDTYFFTYNTVGSTSPTLPEQDINIIAIGVACIDRITQMEKSSQSLIFSNPIYNKKDKGYSIEISN